MRLARVRHRRRVRHGVIEGDTVHFIRGGLFGSHERTGESAPLSEVRLLVPVIPGKVLAIGLNYRSHVESRDVPAATSSTHPEPFIKTASSVVGPDDPIVLPAGVGRVDEEGEVVAVIGRRARRISEREVDAHVLGYTCGNDVSAREWQRADLQWWRAKSSDSFSPLGPCIATGLDPEDIDLVARVNGRVVQQANTRDLINSIRACVAYISTVMTLDPGDVVYTGTPGTTVEIHPGDVVEVEVAGVGVLRNAVIAEAGAASK